MKTKNVPFTEAEARAMYTNAPQELREKLEATFGIETLTHQEPAIAKTDIRDIVKTYEDACRITGDTPIDEDQLKASGFTEAEIALRKLQTIGKALNEGTTLSWEDDDQQKWFPYFYVSPGGFSFYVTYFNYSNPFAGLASRLCFVSSEIAAYAGRQFIDLYKISIL